jgi:7-carboxy-7-deazaguanine synthase
MIKLNNQEPESRVIHTGGQLAVQSIFYTIQGEGPYSGRPSVFVRLAGCNLQCPACDTDYTSSRRFFTINEILRTVNDLVSGLEFKYRPTTLVVITGGEPFRQQITPLVNSLFNRNYEVQIETNGTLPPQEGLEPFCDIVCSPKTGSVNKLLIPKITAYKYVLSHDSIDHSDGLPRYVLAHTAGGKVARPHPGFLGPVYIQPADTGDAHLNKLNVEACVSSCMLYGYILQLQIHKLIGVE